MQIDIKEIAKIKPEPGDVIVFQLGQDYSRDVLKNIDDHLQGIFPNNEIIVAPYKMVSDIKIVKAGEQNE